MDVRWITANGLEWRSIEELEELLDRDDGFVWLDIPNCDAAAAAQLRELGFHPLAVRECQERMPIPKVHVYKDHFFVVLHTIETGEGGKLQLQQMNCFIHESRYFVTVHGAPEPGAGVPETVVDELEVVRHRIETGRFRPKSPAELAHAAMSTLANGLEAFVATLAMQITDLERNVVHGRLREYEKMLDALFAVRHRLQVVRTIAAHSREVHARMVAFSRSLQSESTLWLQDILDHFDRLKNICDGEKEKMQEILDLYQTRVANDLSQLIRKLTAIGAILVADTLVAGIYGMNFDVMPELHWAYGYPFALGIMVVISAGMAWWFHKKDWL